MLYPELESHPQHYLHKKQTKGMSGMLSFYIKGGMEESREFLANLKASQIFSNFFLPFDEQTKISEYF